MDITIHHTVEFGGTTALIILLAAAIIAFAVLYPMMIPAPDSSAVLPEASEPPKGKMGFV